MTRKKEQSEIPTLRLTALWQKDGLKSGKLLRETKLGDFPNVEAAAQFLRESNPAATWPYLFCYRLEPTPEYQGDTHPVTIFDREGIKHGGYDHSRLDCFSGRTPNECRFKPGDIVMFRDWDTLRIGVIDELPPDPDFAKQTGEESGRLDEVDDSYMISYAKRGRRFHHLHECELFAPETLIPKYLVALQKKIQAGHGRNSVKPHDFYHKGLFLNWMVENKHLFSHEPYLAEEKENYFRVCFKGVTNHISCGVTESGDISISVYYRNQFYDIIMEFDLYEEETPEGRYLCRMCRDHPNEENPPEVIEYENRAELWIKHSFEKLAAYTREEFTADAVLCLSRFGVGSTSACIVAGEKLEKLRKKESLFKEIQVVVQKEK